MTTASLPRLFFLASLAASAAACSLGSSFGDDAPGSPKGAGSSGGASGGGPTALACSDDAIPPPRDLPPRANGSLCISAPLNSLAELVGRSAAEVERIDADVLVGDCVGVQAPEGLTFVVGAALRKDETGADYARAVRLPLPSDVAAGRGPSVATGTTLLVAKVAEFRDETMLRFVNVATVKEEGGKRFIETLSDEARSQMSSAMAVDGPGLYAFYLSRRPIGFVSGRVEKSGAPVPGAVAIGTTAPFLNVADAKGEFTLPLARGDKASIAAFELSTRWSGEVHLPIEEGGKTNPKTDAPVETPATEQPIPGLDAVNLVGVTVALEAPGANVAALTTTFDDGDLGDWSTGGAVSVLAEKRATLFSSPGSSRYAFLTTGAGSKGNAMSRMSREVTVPEGAKELVIEYNFVSQEYPGWVGTIYNDAFVAYVAGDTHFLLAETVNGNAGRWQDYFESVGNVSQSTVAVGGVSGTFGGTTGARTARVPVEGCTGKTVTLVLAISDVGDTIYDSAVAIDRIGFE
jgi:hypothetical protein